MGLSALAHDIAVSVRDAGVAHVLLTTEDQLLAGDFPTDLDIAVRSPAAFSSVVSALERAGIFVLSSWSDYPGSRAFLCAREDLSDSVTLDVQTDRWGGGLYRLSFDKLQAASRAGAATGLTYLGDRHLEALRAYKSVTKPDAGDRRLDGDDEPAVLAITRLRDKRQLDGWLRIARACNHHRRLQKLVVWLLFPWLLAERVVAPIGMVVRLSAGADADGVSDRLRRVFGRASVRRDRATGHATIGRAYAVGDYVRALTRRAVVRITADDGATAIDATVTRARHRYQRRVRRWR